MTNKNLLKKYLPSRGSRRAAVAFGLAAAVSLPVAAAAISSGDDETATSQTTLTTSQTAPSGSYGAGNRGNSGNPGNSGGSLDQSLPDVTEPLTPAELDSLIYMREEEKLAHDVYVVLGETWGDDTFTRIAGSESKHQEAIVTLLDLYGIADPVTETAVGEFINPDLQALFDDLVEQGSGSVLDAYKVGALIEELDIVDLREAAAGTTSEAIDEVMARLESGSNNHLRAFDSRIQSLGETYETSFLDQGEYDAIAAADHESGGQSEGHGQVQGQGQGGGHGQGQGGGHGQGYGEGQGHDDQQCD